MFQTLKSRFSRDSMVNLVVGMILAMATVGPTTGIVLLIQVHDNQTATDRYIHDTVCALYSQAHRACPLPPVK